MASEHILGVQVPETVIFIVLQGPSLAMNELHYSSVPVKNEHGFP